MQSDTSTLVTGSTDPADEVEQKALTSRKFLVLPLPGVILYPTAIYYFGPVVSSYHKSDSVIAAMMATLLPGFAASCRSPDLLPIQAVGRASAVSVSGYQCGPNSGSLFQVAAAPVALSTKRLRHLSMRVPADDAAPDAR